MANNATMNTILGIEGYDLNSVDIDKSGRKDVTVLCLTCAETPPSVCPVCGEKMYKHTSKTLRVSSVPINGGPAIWDITIPRRRCRKCKTLWKADLPNVDERHRLTSAAYLDITQKSLRRTFSDVADEYCMSEVTVKNIFTSFLEDNERDLRFQTPKFIGIDEIKLKKIGEVTVITDLEHHTLFDMLLGRNQQALTNYFFNLEGRDEVLWVCSDMYRPFQKPIGDAMPNARWVIDHFHVVMKANEAVDYVRRTVQAGMTKKDRIKTKRGLAYTLKTRAKDLSTDEAYKIRLCRSDVDLKPLAVAFDLKEDFFNIYDENRGSKENAQKAFAAWKETIPAGPLYEKFRELAKTVENFYEQIFNAWDCPIQISNGFTECTNRIIRENNIRGRGYSFEVLRGRTLFRQSNLTQVILKKDLGPAIPKDGPVFYYEGTFSEKEGYDEDDEYDDTFEADEEDETDDGHIPFDPETGEILEQP